MRGSKWAGKGSKWAGYAAFIFCFCLAATHVASPAQAMAKVKCGKTQAVVGTGVIDPIVHHNEPVGSGHEHQFFGSASFLTLENPNSATQADFETGTTLCDNPADTAGYWSPTLRTVDTGELVGVQQFTAYYRCPSGAQNGCPDEQPIPQGARLVARVYNWTCGTKSGARSAPVDHVPDCRGLSGQPGLTLTSHVTFPSCWDGVQPDHSDDADVVGDTQDTAHFAYPVRKLCPAAFPIGVTQIKETVQYHYVGDPANVVLSSDEHDGVTGGRSLHADYVQSWQPDGLQSLLNSCVSPSRNLAKSACG